MIAGNSHNLRDSLPDDSIDLVVITFRRENPPQDIVLGSVSQFNPFNPAYSPDLEVIPEHFRGGDIFRNGKKDTSITGFDKPENVEIVSMYHQFSESSFLIENPL